MVAIQECFEIYTQVWSCFKGNTQQSIAEVKTLQKQFKFTVNQIYCTIYIFILYKIYILQHMFYSEITIKSNQVMFQI